MTILSLIDVFVGPLTGVTWTADIGMHVVLTEPADFGATFVEVISGVRKPKRGQIRVQGADPSRSPAMRRRIATVLADEQAPDGRSLVSALRAEFRMRGIDLEPSDVLGAWGLEGWRDADPSRLDNAERRAVALATALSLPSAQLVGIVEPFSDVAQLSREQIRDHLVRASASACVVCTTAVPRDATELGGQVALAREGKLVSLEAPLAEPLSALSGYFMVTAARPRDLLRALVSDPAVFGIQWRGGAADQVLVWSPHGQRLAMAIVRAAFESRCGVRAITPASPSLDLVEAAHAGWAQAVREQAWWLGSRPETRPGLPWRTA